MSKAILVTGATGNQGGAVITALSNNPNFTLLAQTRNTSSTSAQNLLSKAQNIRLVQGNQDDVAALFDAAEAELQGSRIWGVYSVQISQGSGVTHDGEIRQGKAMVDESVKRGVEHFVYSSVERGGDERSWENETPVPHFQSKFAIERYLRDQAGQMGWTILRPTAFMDNLKPGFQAQVFAAVLRDTLGTKPLQWLAVADIGKFVKLAFEDPSKYKGKAIGLAGDELTSQQLSQAFKNKTGQPMDGTYWILGALLKAAITEVKIMVNYFRDEGYGVKIAELRKLHPELMDMETWIEKESDFITKV